jgi:hypothetical protein
MRTVLASLVAAAALVALGADVAAAPAATFHVCGQIRHGPYLKWTLNIPGRAPISLHGTTWTVVTHGAVPCGTAMTIGRMLLQKFPGSLKTVTHQIKPVPKGFDICASEAKAGQVNCYDLKHNRNVTLWQSDPLPYAQVKQIFESGILG